MEKVKLYLPLGIVVVVLLLMELLARTVLTSTDLRIPGMVIALVGGIIQGWRSSQGELGNKGWLFVLAGPAIIAWIKFCPF